MIEIRDSEAMDRAVDEYRAWLIEQQDDIIQRDLRTLYILGPMAQIRTHHDLIDRLERMAEIMNERQRRHEQTYRDVLRIIRWVGTSNLPPDPDDWAYYMPERDDD